jgi:hypothetical protein
MPSGIDWSRTDLGAIYPKLVLFAYGKLTKLSWRGAYYGHVPGGMTAKDFVHQAIEKTEEGIRLWNREISLYRHLCGIISSDINHLADSLENKLTEISDDNVVYLHDSSRSPEEEVVRRSQERHFLQYLSTIDSRLRRLAELIVYDGASRNADLSIEMNLTPQQIENLKRRLRLAIGGYQDYQNGQQKGQV